MADSPEKSPERKDGLTESAFLEREAQRAKAAMAQAWADAKAKAMQGLDPRVWTASHPWYALTGAALAGFVAAYSLTPSKEQEILRKIAKLNRAIAGVEPDADVDTVPAADAATVEGQRVRVAEATADAGRKDRTSGILGTLGKELIKAVGPALMSSITAAIAAKTAAEDNNGHAPENAGADEAEDYSNPT